MLPRLLLFITACLSFSFGSRAQAYEPGVLVTSKGDTLRGLIENGFWVEPPAFIRFRPSAQSASQLFEPRQLRAVSFTGGRYFQCEALPIDYAAETKLEHLVESNYFAVRVDTLLAEVLLNGPVPLRRVVLPGATHYLLMRPNQPILELSERRYLRKNNVGSLVIADGNNYHNQLSVYFSDCPEAAALGRTVPFTAEGMVAVVQAFNQACAPERRPTRSWLAQAAPRRRLSFQGGVLVGARYNRIESSSYALAGPCTDCQPHPYAGLYADLFQPSRTTSVYGELSLSTFRSKGAYPLAFGPGGSTTFGAYQYDALLGTARLGVRYFVPLPREQQLLFSLMYELNRVINPRVAQAGTLAYLPAKEEMEYASTVLLPAVGVGWRMHRLTLSTDIQLYASSGSQGFFAASFVGTNYALRFGAAYRLGRNPDALPAGAATKP